MFQRTPLTRREMLTSAALGLLSLPSLASLAWASRRRTFDEPKRNPYRGSDDQLLDEIERSAFEFFWNEASSTTGQVRDRALLNGNDQRRVANIAATGFGLSGLCIGESRRLREGGGDPGSGAADASLSRAAIAQRARLLLPLHRYRNRRASMEL